jgi:hypothetical protein
MQTVSPNEVVINILSQLPVKSLIRFKYVSRTWSSLISSPNFIAAHLKFYSFQHPPYLLFRHYNDQHKKDRFPLPSSGENGVFFAYPSDFIQLRYPHKSINQSFTIVGSSNALLVFLSTPFHLWLRFIPFARAPGALLPPRVLPMLSTSGHYGFSSMEQSTGSRAGCTVLQRRRRRRDVIDFGNLRC